MVIIRDPLLVDLLPELLDAHHVGDVRALDRRGVAALSGLERDRLSGAHIYQNGADDAARMGDCAKSIRIIVGGDEDVATGADVARADVHIIRSGEVGPCV